MYTAFVCGQAAAGTGATPAARDGRWLNQLPWACGTLWNWCQKHRFRPCVKPSHASNHIDVTSPPALSFCLCGWLVSLCWPMTVLDGKSDLAPACLAACDVLRHDGCVCLLAARLSGLPSGAGPTGGTSSTSLVSRSGRLLEAKYPEPVMINVAQMSSRTPLPSPAAARPLRR